MNIIDTHTHYLPHTYVAALKKHIPGDPDGWPTPSWTPAKTLHFNHEHHIDYSLLSLSSPHINFGDHDETLMLARDANDYGQQLHQKHPNEFGYLASLPLPYVNESVAEIDYALKHDAQGFTVPTNSRGIYFGSPILDPVYAKLNEEQAVVALHPNQPAQLPMNVNIDMPTPLMGFFIDTTMTFINLLRYHFFDKYPDIKLIVPHAGAFMGILADRDALYVKETYHADMYAALKHVYFDTAGAVFPRQLPMLLTLADENHILYGSDIPYTGSLAAGQLLGVIENGGTAAADKREHLLTSAERYNDFLNKHERTAKIPTLLDMNIKMLSGAAILDDELRTKILTTNAQQLFQL